ncbi:hypothetical protein BaRGS_00006605 [Batillaria attramentaria]|uniref:Mif2/CENP-C cupin domain-containing protein n=1 Tax=Batillaria attramentaria TaxID=370345 RepID=A0ABD0LRX1_9CAEN
MPPKKFQSRTVTNPFKNKNIGRRTGKDVRAGKNIRKVAGGFENFDDYWSESDADITRDGTFIKPGTPAGSAAQAEVRATVKQDQSDCGKQTATQDAQITTSGASIQPAVLSQSQAGNVGHVKGALNPFRNKQIGRRTGKDIKAGKNIGILQGGFENFDDYWSESDADSMASFSTSTTSRRSSAARRSTVHNVQPAKTESAKKSSVPNQKDTTLTEPATTVENAGTAAVVTEEETSDSQGTGAEADCEDGGEESQEDEDAAGTGDETLVAEGHESAPRAKQQDGADGRSSQATQKDPSEDDQANSQTESEVPSSVDVQQSGRSTVDSQDSCSCAQAEESSAVESQVSGSDTDRPDQAPAKDLILPESGQVTEKNTRRKSQRNLQATSSGSSVVEITCGDSEPDSKYMGRRSSPRKTAVSVAEEQEDLPSHPEVQGHVDEATTGEDSQGEEETTPTNLEMTAGKPVSVIAPPSPTSKVNKNSQDDKITASQKPETTTDEEVSLVQPTEKANQVKVAESVSAAVQLVTDHDIGLGVHSQTSVSHSQVGQMTTTAPSPEPMTQKSSIYVSIAGDVTGSITRQDSEALSPGPRLFGTRKRLSYSYAASPEKAEQTKKKEKKSKGNLPREPTIPEHHQETQDSDEKELPHNAPLSQSSASETGMFVSLATKSTHQDKTQATITHVSVSDDENEFEILDDSKIYNTKVKKEHKQSAKATNASQRKRTTSRSAHAGDSDEVEKTADKPKKDTKKPKASEKQSVSGHESEIHRQKNNRTTQRKQKNKKSLEEPEDLPDGEQECLAEDKPDAQTQSRKKQMKRSKEDQSEDLAANNQEKSGKTTDTQTTKKKLKTAKTQDDETEKEDNTSMHTEKTGKRAKRRDSNTEPGSVQVSKTQRKRGRLVKTKHIEAAEDVCSADDQKAIDTITHSETEIDADELTPKKQQKRSKSQGKVNTAEEADNTTKSRQNNQTRKRVRPSTSSRGVAMSVMEEAFPEKEDGVDGESPVELEAETAESQTPATPCLSRIEVGDSALKSGISFRRLSHHPTSNSVKRSRRHLSVGESHEILPDDIATPPILKQSRRSDTDTPLTHPKQRSGLTSCVRQPEESAEDMPSRRNDRRVTISNIVTHHELSSPASPGTSGEVSDATVLPSMSTTPVHYFHLSSPVSEPQEHDWEKKIIQPQHNTASGLRRSQRTRVKALEWYKNERIIYDRRKSGPVIVAVQPSKERVYLEQESLKRRRRRQGYLVRKKQQLTRGKAARRLSTQVPVPEDVQLTPRTEVTVLHPHTREAVHMACFNPASMATEMGPRGDDPLPDDPYTMKLLTQQRLFTTGVLTLAPAAEKPLQRAISTAVVFSVTFGKILVTINTASKIMETGDHFFVPGGTVYKLKNLRKEAATLTFTNLMMDAVEQPTEQPSEQVGEQQEESSEH